MSYIFNLVKKLGQVKNIALIFIFTSLAVALIFVRKRQLIKRILSYMFRFGTEVAAL